MSTKQVPVASTSNSHTVTVDPDNLLTPEMQSNFRAVLSRYDDVFESDFKGYNGAVGPFEAHVNMGPTQPPQRKGILATCWLNYNKCLMNWKKLKFSNVQKISGCLLNTLNNKAKWWFSTYYSVCRCRKI